jgi:hypothetical protein
VTASSLSNVGQASVHSQQIKLLQNDNGIKIQHPANIPINIILSQLASQLQQSSNTSPPKSVQGTGDSTDLTAMEKITKLKTQWLNQLP